MPPKRYTGSVAGQQPAQQHARWRGRQRSPPAGNVPTTLCDIDLRDIRLGVNMPALSDNAELCLLRERLTDVLRWREGCTIEALVVGPEACCKSDENVQAVQQLPWWPRAVQMRTLIAAGTLTLGHWSELSKNDRERWTDIHPLLERRRQRVQAAARRRGVTTQLTWQQQLQAERQARLASDRARAAEVSLLRYLNNVRAQAAGAHGHVESDLPAATAIRGQVTATTEAAQPQQQATKSMYGQEKNSLLSDVTGQALYDSVYKATWGALRYTADGVHAKIPLAAEDVVLPVVPCGTLPDTLIMDDSSVAAARRKSTAHDVLTLYSPLGWPAMWELATLQEHAPLPDEVARRVTAASAAQQLGLESIDYDNTLFVRGEVQRVWRRIERTRDEAQLLRRGSATTQGTATAAAAAPAQAQGEHDDDAEAAPAQIQASESEEQVASTAFAPAQAQGERHSDTADADAHDEQHDDATSTHGQAQMHRDDCNDEAEEHVSAQDDQQSNAAEASAQALAQGEQHSNVAQLQAAQGSAVPLQSSASSNTVATRNRNAFVIVRGTPGIGKTMAVGGYVLYKLLHEEGERALPYVLFEVDNLSFVFDKRKATVACYKRASFGAEEFVSAVRRQCARIFDCSKTRVYAKEETKIGAKLNIVITSPNTSNTRNAETNCADKGLLRYAIVHAWSLREMLLVGRYLDIDEATMRDNVTKVGPLPRNAFEKSAETVSQCQDFTSAALKTDTINNLNVPLCDIRVESLYDKDNPTNKVFDLRRGEETLDDAITQDERDAAVASGIGNHGEVSSLFFIPLSLFAKDKLKEAMLGKQRNNQLYFGSVLCYCIDHPRMFERCVNELLVKQAMWEYIAGTDNGDNEPRCTYLPRRGDGADANEPDTPLRHNTLCEWVSRMPEREVMYFDDRATITFDTRDSMRVFVPRSQRFPLVDAFILLTLNKKVHYIGIQVTISDRHNPTKKNVRSFYVCHPKIVVEGADEQTPQQPSLTRVTPPTRKISTQVALKEKERRSIDVLYEYVFPGAAIVSRTILYVKRHGDPMLTYQEIEHIDQAPNNLVNNWRSYKQYCCRVKTSDIQTQVAVTAPVATTQPQQA